MDLKHDQLSQQKAARELKVKINGLEWHTQKIAVVRLVRGGPQWVLLEIVDSYSSLQHRYLMQRLPMIKAWLELDADILKQKHVDALVLEHDNKPCRVLRVFKELKQNEQWISIEIKCIDIDKVQIISIERQSMINAYYALRLSVEDIFETAVDVVSSIFD